MALKYNLKYGSCNSQSACLDTFGCPQNACPDFVIRRHDTRPALKVEIQDCDGPMDFRGLVVEANMWANAKFKKDLTDTSDSFQFADNIGFDQVMVGDVIIVDQVRSPEHMLVLGFDEHNKFIRVQRGYHGTNIGYYKKGTKIRIFRMLSAQAVAEMIFEDVQTVEGKIEKDVIQSSHLVYEWQPSDTCLPGCYWLEFKVLKMIDIAWSLPGGHWVGEVFTNPDGYFYTGSTQSDSAVKLSYDQVQDKYLLPITNWSGEVHLHTDNNYYTGLIHTDGSVFLSRNGIPSDSNVAYNESGILGFHDISIIPSFTDISLTPSDFGCTLGEGVEWVRRFPVSGEGFLIRVEFSPTTEI
jgi:hypothetical protein